MVVCVVFVIEFVYCNGDECVFDWDCMKKCLLFGFVDVVLVLY